MLVAFVLPNHLNYFEYGELAVATKKSSPPKRTVALGYVRQSITRKIQTADNDAPEDEERSPEFDMDSPERQRSILNVLLPPKVGQSNGIRTPRVTSQVHKNTIAPVG